MCCREQLPSGAPGITLHANNRSLDPRQENTTKAAGEGDYSKNFRFEAGLADKSALLNTSAGRFSSLSCHANRRRAWAYLDAQLAIGLSNGDRSRKSVAGPSLRANCPICPLRVGSWIRKPAGDLPAKGRSETCAFVCARGQRRATDYRGRLLSCRDRKHSSRFVPSHWNSSRGSNEQETRMFFGREVARRRRTRGGSSIMARWEAQFSERARRERLRTRAEKTGGEYSPRPLHIAKRFLRQPRSRKITRLCSSSRGGAPHAGVQEKNLASGLASPLGIPRYSKFLLLPPWRPKSGLLEANLSTNSLWPSGGPRTGRYFQFSDGQPEIALEYGESVR